MIYINPQGEYPRHYGDIQLDNPTWELGDELPEGWVKVEESPRPEITSNQVAYEVHPVETDGVWYQTWEVRDLTTEEIEARKVAEVKRKIYNGEPITEQEALLLVG
jgi:hypothetical protein